MAQKVKYTQPLFGEANALGYLIMVPGASVLIRQNGVACTVYSSNAGAAMTNPVPTGVSVGTAGVDVNGTLLVYLEPGNGYDGVATVGAAVSTFPIPDISPDVADANVVQVAKVSSTTNVALTGLLVIDGYQTVAGDTVLLTGQTTASQNGPWVVASGAWARPGDFANGSVVTGRTIVVSGGTARSGTVWTLSGTAPVTVGTTAQTWVNSPIPSGAYVATAPAALQEVTQPASGATPLKLSGHSTDVSGSYKRLLELWAPNAPWAPLGIPLYVRSDNLQLFTPAAITISTQVQTVGGVPQILQPTVTQHMMGVWNDLSAGSPSYVSRDSGVGDADVSDHFWALGRTGLKVLTIGPKGNIGIPDARSTEQVYIQSKDAATIALALRAIDLQTASLFEWRDPTGAIKGRIEPLSGRLFVASGIRGQTSGLDLQAATGGNLTLGDTDYTVVTVSAVGAALRLTFAENARLAFGTVTGTRIGTASTQKMSFWNAAPVVQPAGITDASTAHALSAVFSDTEVEAALNALGAKINAIIANLETIGLQAIA